MTRVITFYSYKGGTGRSMALANVAWILASAGKRVLAIDWDLEAPGLHRYFQPFLTDKELFGQESQGVIDMAIDFAVRAATPPKAGEQTDSAWYTAYADFSKWRQKLRWPSGESIKLGKDSKGEIDFVPAGRQGTDYARQVNHFDWRSFYENLGGGAFFDAAKRKLDSYDYVLIDSRTGVSDTSGICTVHLPDTLVVCFTLNYQSIKGALAVAQSVRAQRPDIRIFPVPMRIDGSEEKLLNKMKSYAATAFGPLLDPKISAAEYWYAMEVPYLARYAYAEKLALFEPQASITGSTLPAMERLTGYLTDQSVPAAGPLPEDERELALAEFEGRAVREDVEAADTRPHVVIFVLGTRTSAIWDQSLRRVLENERFRVEFASYGHQGALRFLFPLRRLIAPVVEDVAMQVRHTLSLNRGADCSIIASGLGTLLVARMMRDNADLRFKRIILCGSVVRKDFPFHELSGRFEAPLLNEVAARALGPVLAESATFGYGSSGTTGFRRPGIFDRWHSAETTLEFLNAGFCWKYWLPFLVDGEIVQVDEPVQTSIATSMLSALKIKYLVITVLIGLISVRLLEASGILHPLLKQVPSP